MLKASEAVRRLPDLKFPPLNLSIEPHPKTSAGSTLLEGWTARITWDGCQRMFLIDYKSSCSPRDVENAIARFRFLAPTSKSELLPMLVAPYLAPKSLDRLLANGISAIDMSGNGVVVVPGKWLIYRTGEPNRFKSSAPIKDVFRGTSSLVGRILLTQRTFKNVSAVRDGIVARGVPIALSTVSKVLKRLDEELLVARGDEIELVNAESLLDRLTAGYVAPEITKRLRVRTTLDESFFRRVLQPDEPPISVVVSGYPLYAVAPTSEQRFVVYTSSIDQLLRRVEVSEDARFGTVELCETTDQRIFFDSRRKEGMIWTPPLQVYLELATGTERDRNVATQLRPSIIDDG